MTRLRDLIAQGLLAAPGWVKHAYSSLDPEDAVLAWAPPTGDALNSANSWAKRLGGGAILIAIPDTASRFGEQAAGCVTDFVVAEPRGGLSRDLVAPARLAHWKERYRQEWPAAIVLRRLFRILPDPVPMRGLWSDEVRLDVMRQISGAAKPLPLAAVEPLLGLDVIELPVPAPYGDRARLETLGRANPAVVQSLLRQASKTVREGFREDPKLAARLYRAAGVARQVRNGAKAAHGELRCESCARASGELVAQLGPGVERAWHAHHRTPLELGGRDSRAADFAILCAFCHELAHSSRPALSVEEVKAAVRIVPRRT